MHVNNCEYIKWMKTDSSDVTLQKGPFLNSTLFWIITLIQIAFNVVVFTFLLQGTTTTPMLPVVLISELISIPILCMIIAFLVALIPYRQQGFNTKFKRALLWLYFVINSIISTLLLVALVKEALFPRQLLTWMVRREVQVLSFGQTFYAINIEQTFSDFRAHESGMCDVPDHIVYFCQASGCWGHS